MLRKALVYTAAIVGLLIILGGLGGTKALQFMALASMGEIAPSPEIVTTASVVEDTWEPALAAVGSVTAVQGVTLKNEEAGTVRHIAFESGAAVAAGDLLVELDTSSEQAQLRAAEATAELARLSLERARDLRRQNTIAQAELDAALAQFDQAYAQVENVRALIAKKTIRAPFAGRVGIRQVNLGQFVPVGSPIVSLQSLHPVYVDFALPQQRLAQVQPGMTVRVTTDSFPGAVFVGRLTAVNPEVDPVTRNVHLQATLANEDGRLRPGMFVNVAAVLPEKERVLVVPVTAVRYAPYGDSVFVVEEKTAPNGETSKVLRQQFVRLGRAQGDFVVVVSGLAPGETVVSTGVFKLRNGLAVTVDNSLAPQPSLKPTPANS
jgi:membrane fusion protein (multidrug efflux system)